MSTPPAEPVTSASPSARAVRRTVLTAATIGAVVVSLVLWQRHRLADLPAVLGRADLGWIGAAIALQAISVAAAARLNRGLLGVDGRRHPFRPILATTYAGSAISVSLPLVGSTASVLFTYQRYLRIGAEKVVAAWTLAVSGVYSTVTLVAISAVGALMTGSVGAAVAGGLTLVVGVLPVLVVLSGLQNPRIQPSVRRFLAGLIAVTQRLIGRPAGDPVALADSAVDQITRLRLGRRGAVRAVRSATVNWAADIACLVCALQAVGAPIPWHGLLLAWAAGAGVSSAGLTPGGLGVVEAALSVALVAAGLPAGLAVSAVLLYRFIKLWLVLAAGALTLLVIRVRDRQLTISRPAALDDALAQRTDLAPEAVRESALESVREPRPRRCPISLG